VGEGANKKAAEQAAAFKALNDVNKLSRKKVPAPETPKP
jgi:dsRNA-specific ribonuclease